MAALDIRNVSRREAPAFPFAKARKIVLPRFEVSLAFVTPREATRLNRSLRKKAYTPNVLSFRTSPTSGEIIICLAEAKSQAASYGLSYHDFVGFLFIHALLHLEGRQHGTTMEKTERKLFERVTGTPYPDETSNRNGHRRRDPSGQDSRRRRNA